jgi:ketosteroid isomerase-like protein
MNSTDSRTTFDAYRAAWARHDLDAIVSMHHPEGTFWLHTAGEAVVVGHDAIRAKFAGTLAMVPDIAYESLRLHWGDDFLVHELSASGTPMMAPDGGAIRFDMVDVIEFRDGLLWTKNTYVDASPIAARLQARSTSVNPG